jgi:hypothetical protein
MARRKTPTSTSHIPRRGRRTAVAEILSKAAALTAPEQIEELTAGLVALRAKRLAPVASAEESRLLIAINEGVPVGLRDRVASLIEKRNGRGLTAAEETELMELADRVERRGADRLQALTSLAELRGVSLRELMKSLGITSENHG